MKKRNLIAILFIFILILVGCGKKSNSYIEVKYEELQKKFENKESFALFVGSHECSHCDDYKITLNKFISNYNVEVFYLDIANLSDDELSEFRTIVNFSSTPTTVFITNGVEETTYNRIIGALPYNKIVSKFEKAGYIKEK